MSEFLKTLITVVFSGAFFGALFSFLQFLITRKDNQKGMEKLIKDSNQEVRNEIKELRKEVQENKRENEQYRAVQARTHILAFSDELRNGYDHSEEYFKQVLLDIDTYNNYCSTHAKFENGLTKLASEFIYETYRTQYLIVDD